MAGLGTIIEPMGYMPPLADGTPDKKHPDISIAGFGSPSDGRVDGRTLLLDVTVVDPAAPSYIEAEVKYSGTTMARAEEEKRVKYAALDDNLVEFQPLAMTSFGELSEESLRVLTRITSVIPGRWTPTSATARTPMDYFLQCISVAIHRTGAEHALLLRRQAKMLGDGKGKQAKKERRAAVKEVSVRGGADESDEP